MAPILDKSRTKSGLWREFTQTLTLKSALMTRTYLMTLKSHVHNQLSKWGAAQRRQGPVFSHRPEPEPARPRGGGGPGRVMPLDPSGRWRVAPAYLGPSPPALHLTVFAGLVTRVLLAHHHPRSGPHASTGSLLWAYGGLRHCPWVTAHSRLWTEPTGTALLNPPVYRPGVPGRWDPPGKV